MKVKTICVSSSFPTSADAIWEKLQQINTLQYVAAPYATFTPVGDAVTIWEEGKTLKFHLKLFGLIPIGVHTINVMQFDKDGLTIFTNESNKGVSVWNHRVILEEAGNNRSYYTDKVEIYAGWKTLIVIIWCRLFYKHRHKKWLELLR